MASEIPPEGSEARATARIWLLDGALNAARVGLAYEVWILYEEQTMLDSVSQRDLEAIRQMAWASDFFHQF